MTKTRSAAGVYSRRSTHVEYDTVPGTAVLGARNIGGPNVDSFLDGVNYPNVQAAIEELQASIVQIPVNGIYMSTVKETPEGTGQAEALTFNGTSTGPAELQKTVIKVYGIPFVIEKGVSADVFCNAVLQKFEEMMLQTILFKSVVRRQGTTTPILDVQFIDNAAHLVNDTMGGNGITIQREITQPAIAGYGSWDFLGSEDKTLTGGSAQPAMPIYYFKRIG